MIISSLKDIDVPMSDLEQYMTPTPLVCDILYEAYACGDIQDRTVMELGCGSAPFAIGASLLGADRVFGVDLDPGSIAAAVENKKAVEKGSEELDIEFVEADVSESDLPEVDTVLMNPPFGAQKKHADRPFVEAAIKQSRAIYSIHNGNSMDFLGKLCASLGADIELLFKTGMELPHRYSFHRKEKSTIDVIVVRIKSP